VLVLLLFLGQSVGKGTLEEAKQPRKKGEKACKYGASVSLIACQGYLGRPGLRLRPLRNAAHQFRQHPRRPALPHHEADVIKKCVFSGVLRDKTFKSAPSAPMVHR